ncbi:MAG: class I SAM-dependent methyltransferase [Dactylosporangium sp.]|nr:class I SAM-dependent methyltransferase [Dactylosporangium sp.]NNJ62637.1 class I SAM-dependent methyltransferase [Dactylosporangium sp.]
MPVDLSRPYQNSAGFYADYRYRISSTFGHLLAARLRLTGKEQLLDLGCGPGILAERLAPYAAQIAAVDPEPDMLTEGIRRCAAADVTNVRFVRADSHNLAPVTDLAPFRAVTIGQALHWMYPQDQVLERLTTLTDRTGAVVLVTPTAVTAPAPWWQDIDTLLETYLADIPQEAHPGNRTPPFDEILHQSAFCHIEELYFEYETQEQPNLTAALGMRYGISWVFARLGNRREALEAEARERLGWIDDLPPRQVRRRDSAIFGFRSHST